MQYLGGVIAIGGAAGTSTKPFEATFVFLSQNEGQGFPSYFIDRKIDLKAKTVKFYDMGAINAIDPVSGRRLLIQEYDYNRTIDPTVYVATPYYNPGSTKNINVTALGNADAVIGRLDAVVVAPNLTSVQCYYDPDGYTSSAYSALFAAPGKAMMAIIQDWQLSPNGTYLQWFDPTINVISPISSATVKGNVAYNQANYYTEDGIVTATCWQSWPVFQTGTPLVDDITPGRDGLALSCDALGKQILASCG